MRSLPTVKRRSVHLAARDLVAAEPLVAGGELPLVLHPKGGAGSVDLGAWAADQRSSLDQMLDRHGALLFRGFAVSGPEDFSAAVRALGGDLLDYRDRATPRTAVGGRLYSSTDYPPDQTIELHNENCYAASFPARIFFYCRQPAESGGATPLADGRRVDRALDPEVRRRFAQRGVMYVRNFRDGLGLSWQEVFQTEDRGELERYCREAGIDWEWLGPSHLRTRQVRPAFARHPRTAETVWLNQAVAFHISTVEGAVGERLLAEYGPDGVPKTSCYGDGSPFPAEDLAAVREAYRQATVDVPWLAGDVLAVDNLLVAHGRRPYRGPRQVIVAMAQEIAGRDVWIEEGGER